jgi:hypothetical protein
MNPEVETKKKLSEKQQEEMIATLKSRFEKNMIWHRHLDWSKVQSKLNANSDKMYSLYEMERTGGQPDIIDYNQNTKEYIFVDCSPESPEGRRNLCYDRAGLEGRKEFKPQNSAMDMAESMGIDLLNEEQYRELQKLGNFDIKTSSWLKTPEAIRKRGGAIFADRRYDHVFVYHNGASSYYAVRGFRGSLKL